MKEYKQDEFLGHVEITPEAIELIVGIAASKVKEVHSVQSTIDLFSKSFSNKGVSLKAEEDGTFNVDVYVALKYGSSVPKVAKHIQNRIKEQVYFMCNITINQVNVHVTQLVSTVGVSSE